MPKENLSPHFTAFKWNEGRNELTPLTRIGDRGTTVFKTQDEAYQALELDIATMSPAGVIFECRPLKILRHCSPDVEQLQSVLSLKGMKDASKSA